MPVLGINTATIKANSYMAVKHLQRPAEIVPISFHKKYYDEFNAGLTQSDLGSCAIPDRTKNEVLIWGNNQEISHQGNFGALDLLATNGQKTGGAHLQDLIYCGFPCKNPEYPGTPPMTGEAVDVKTGFMGTHILDGLYRRYEEGRTQFFIPVTNFDLIKGGKVKIEAYVLINGLAFTHQTAQPKNKSYYEDPAGPPLKVCVYGTIEKSFRPTSLDDFIMKSNSNVRQIQLVTAKEYELIKKDDPSIK